MHRVGVEVGVGKEEKSDFRSVLRAGCRGKGRDTKRVEGKKKSGEKDSFNYGTFDFPALVN